MRASSPTVAILLAAGGGSRFQGSEHKLTALISKRAVCSWSLQHLLEAKFESVVVVTGAVDLLSALEIEKVNQSNTVQIIHNPLWQSGLASSLQCGINVARDRGAQAVVVGLADQPAVTSEIALVSSSGRGGSRCSSLSLKVTAPNGMLIAVLSDIVPIINSVDPPPMSITKV